MQEALVQSPSQGDPLEKGMATHSSILAWRILWTEEPGGLQFMGSQGVGQGWVANVFTFSLSFNQDNLLVILPNWLYHVQFEDWILEVQKWDVQKDNVVNVHLPAVQETGFMTPWT